MRALAAIVAILAVAGCSTTTDLKPGETYEIPPGELIIVEPDGTIWRDDGPRLYEAEYVDPFDGIDPEPRPKEPRDVHPANKDPR